MCQLDFRGQIVKFPQVLSHLLLVLVIFPLPHPCAIRFLKSNRPPQVLSHRAFSGRLFFPCRAHVPSDFPGQIVKSPQVLSHLLLVVAIFPLPHPCAIRFLRSNRQIPTSPISSAFSGRYFSLAAPMCHSISQVKSSNLQKVLSHLLCSGRYSAFFRFTLFSCMCLPLCLSVVSPRGGNCNCSPSRPHLSSEAVGASSSKRLPGETQRVP